MNNLPFTIQSIEAMQTRDAVPKHSLRFIKDNPAFNTLDLYTINMSGSYLRSPLGRLRIHSVHRLEYPRILEKEDILRVIFFKDDEKTAYSLDFPVKTLYSPKKILAGFQSIGVTFNSTLPASELAKLLADFLASKITFGKIAALPGWEHYPSDSDDLLFLRPDTLSAWETDTPLSGMQINQDDELSFADILQELNITNLEQYPIEITLLFLLRLFASLRTFLEQTTPSASALVNLVLEENNTATRDLLARFLSLYKNQQVYSLPMSQASLKEVTILHKDNILLLTIPSCHMTQYQHCQLMQNLDELLQFQTERAFTPIIFSDGFLSSISLDNVITIPISNNILKHIASKKLDILGNVTLAFLEHVQNNQKTLQKNINVTITYSLSTYSNMFFNLLSIWDHFENFILMHGTMSKFDKDCYFYNTYSKLSDYFEVAKDHTEFWGIPEQFIEALKKEIMGTNIKVIPRQSIWNPRTMASSTILKDKTYILISPVLFNKIVAKTFCHVHSLTVLKSLDDAAYLITDHEHSGKKHYKKKIFYNDTCGRKKYCRFIVLKTTALNLTDGPRLY